MKFTNIKQGLLLLSLSTALQAQVNWIEAPVKQQLQNLTVNKSNLINSEQTPVSYNQSLLGQNQIIFENKGYVAESKQYWLDANGKELAQGVPLPLTSETAVIRINPLHNNNNKLAIKATQLQLSFKGANIQPEMFVNADQLKAVGMPVTDETVAFKVISQPGELTLKLTDVDESAAYVIHVLELESEYILSLNTQKQRYANGADVVVKANLNLGEKPQYMRVHGYISTPTGEKHSDLNFALDQDGGYQALVSGLKGLPLSQGLWEVHTITEAEVGGLKVIRDASTAFAVNLATARFSGDLSMSAQHLKVGIENVMPSRYEVKGVLYGLDDIGEQQPIALMMSAKWLDQGLQQIAFELPMELIEASGYQGPFTIKQVELKNQSLMSPVQLHSAGIQLNLSSEGELLSSSTR